MDAIVSGSVKNLTSEELKWKRVNIYKSHIKGGVPSVYLRIKVDI